MSEVDLKMDELIDKYRFDNNFDVFINMNRYNKFFLRVNVFLPEETISKTFNWNLRGYYRAVDFIESYKQSFM